MTPTYWVDSDLSHCLQCQVELTVHEDYEPILCHECVGTYERVERAWGTIIIVAAIAIYLVAVTVGVKFYEWNWPT